MADLEQGYKLLKQYYDLALSSSDQASLFIRIMKYVEVVDKNKDLQDLVYEHVVKVGRKDRKRERDLEKKLTTELDNIFTEISVVKNENNIKDKTFLYRYNFYQSYILGTVDSSDGPVYGRSGAMSALTDNMLNSNIPVLLEKAKEYAVYDDKNNFVDWAYLKGYYKLDKYKDKFNRNKHTKIYYNWDKLAHMYNIYTDYDKYYQQAYKKNKAFMAMGLSQAKEEINAILENKHDKTKHRFIDLDELKNNLIYFNTDFEPIVVKSLATTKPKKKKLVRAIYNKTTGLLSINGKTVPFKYDTFNGYLINEILTSKGKHVYRGEVLTGFYGPGLEENLEKQTNKNKLYQACNYINSQVASKTGYTELLNFTKDEASLNKKYTT